VALPSAFAAQEQLYFLATHDVLMSLPNRSFLEARITHAIALLCFEKERHLYHVRTVTVRPAEETF
jgi:GGDEF domain-containing protein